MKKNRMMVVALAMFFSATLGVGLTGCSKDEPQPEIVENPLDKNLYHIVGVVTSDDDKVLEGVTVAIGDAKTTTDTNGAYQLSVDKIGNHLVAFAKEGYVSISKNVEIPSNATKNSAVAVNQELASANAAVSAHPDSDTEIIEVKRAVSSLFVPAGAVKQKTDISITEYLEGASNTARASLSTISCTPDGLKFEKPIELKVKNNMSTAIRFADVKHFVEKNGVWVEEGDAPFDAEKNAYMIEMNGFSNHSARANSSKKDAGTSKVELNSIEVDNRGNMNAVAQKVTFKQKSGWEIKGDLSSQISAAFSGLSASDIEGLSEALTRSIAQSQGSTVGVKEMEVSVADAKISGDTKMIVSLQEKQKTTTMSYVMNYQGRDITFNIDVVTYAGVDTQITYEYGEHFTDHSGGGAH